VGRSGRTKEKSEDERSCRKRRCMAPFGCIVSILSNSKVDAAAKSGSVRGDLGERTTMADPLENSL
jgi:hypothetical protein